MQLLFVKGRSRNPFSVESVAVVVWLQAMRELV
jgi:hypothetical protein